MAEKKLKRSANKILAGVCGGIAEYFEVDSTLLRVIYAALSICTGGLMGLVFYFILMLIMPPTDGNDSQSNIQDAEIVK